MFKSIAFFLLFLSGITVRAQTAPLYIGTTSGDILLVDPATCTSSLVVSTGFGIIDLAVCGGQFYVTDAGSTLYQVDPITGTVSNLGTTPGNFNSLVCDGNGNLYAADGAFYSYSIATGTWTFIGFTPNGSGGDLAFYGGNLYLIDGFGVLTLLTLNPYTATVVAPFTTAIFWGLATLPGLSCTQPAVMYGGDLDDLYTIDPATGQNTLICANIINGTIAGMAADPFVQVNTPLTLVSTTVSPLCNGAPTGAAAVSAIGGIAPYSYLWPTIGDVDSSINNVAAGTYTCIVTDSVGCSDTISVTITQPPLLTVSINGPAGVCEGTTAQLNALSTGGTGSVTYQWQPGASTANTITIQPQQTSTYSLVATDANGCTNSTTATVSVWPKPQADFTVAQSEVCAGAGVVFTSLSTVAAPGVLSNYGWDFSGGITATGSSPTVSFSTSGTINATLIVSTTNGCSDTLSLPAVLNILPAPIAEFTFNEMNTDGNFNGQVQFNDSSIGAVDWLWTFGDALGSSSNSQNPQVSYLNPGCFPVVLLVTDSLGCTDSTEQEVCLIAETSFYVPNTFIPDGDGINDVFFPKGVNINEANYQLRIFNRWGSLIFESLSKDIGWDGTYRGIPVQIDTYVWVIQYRDANNKSKQRIGHVNVLR